MFTFILMVISSLRAIASSSVRDKKRTLSRASDELEMSSLRKIFILKNRKEKLLIHSSLITSASYFYW